jgi:arylsulfatase A-like enzyme
MDSGIGKVLATLREVNLEKDTLVVFTSDNGGQLSVGARNGPVRDGKGSMYEGGLRVPFIARWPERIPPGGESDFPAMTVDLFPSLLEAAGLRPTHPVDGISILPTLLGKDQARPDRLMFFTRREGGRPYFGKTIDAVIHGEWKLLHNTPSSSFELYNLRRDPQEKTNLADSERQAFQRLSAALQRHIQRGGAVPWQRPETRTEEKQP